MESGAGIIAGNGWDIGWEILYRAVRRLFKTFAGRFFCVLVYFPLWRMPQDIKERVEIMYEIFEVMADGNGKPTCVGKTVTCVNLGTGFAEAGEKALLMEADAHGSLPVSLGIREPDRLGVTLVNILDKVSNDGEISVKIREFYGERTHLIPELKGCVDENRIPLAAGEKQSHPKKEEKIRVAEAMGCSGLSLSMGQSGQLRGLSGAGGLTADKVYGILVRKQIAERGSACTLLEKWKQDRESEGGADAADTV